MSGPSPTYVLKAAERLTVDTVLIVARVALAGIFAVAAIAKLADMPGSRRALEGFGVPASIVPAGALALPAAELLAAVLLLIEPTAQIGALLAAALLLAFVAGIGAALRRGEEPDCHCFGQLHSKPAGRETLIRNLVLAAAGLFVLIAGGGPSLSAWASDSSGELVALAAVSLAAVMLAYAYSELWRENRRLQGHGPGAELPTPVPIGQPAPEFSVKNADGVTVHSQDLLDQRRSMLVFTSSTCGPCVGLLPELTRWREMLEGRLAIHVLAAGDEAKNRELAEEHGVPLLLDRGSTAASAYGILGTPSGVEIDGSGAVASPPAAGAPAIEALIRASLKRPAADSDVVEVRTVPGAAPVR